MKGIGPLNARQKRFVEEYFATNFNGQQAAVNAGYNPHSARITASKNLTKANIKAAIDARLAHQSTKGRMTVERLLRELESLAFLDPRKLFTPSGQLKPMSEWDDDTARAIASIETVTENRGRDEEPATVRRVRFWDKRASIELYGKHMAMWTDKIEVKDTTPTEVEIEIVTIRKTTIENSTHLSAS